MANKALLHAIGTALIVLIAAALLYYSLHGIEWGTVARTILAVRPGYAALAVAVGILPMFVRAARWRILLQAQGAVSFRTTFWAVAAGYLGNNFLPARGGELVRSYIVQARSELGVSYVLATALSERVADAVALVIIGAATLVITPVARVPPLVAAIGVIGVVGLGCLPLFEKQMASTLDALRLPQRLAARLKTLLQQMLLGMRSLHDWQRFSKFAALTISIWMLDAVATSALAYSMSIMMPLSVSMLLIVALSLSSALPSTPGYVGVYQFVAVTVLKPFGFSASAAIAFILVTQAVSYAVTGVLGILAVTRFTPFNWRACWRPFQSIHIQS